MAMIVTASAGGAAPAPAPQPAARHRALNPTEVSYCQAHEVSGHAGGGVRWLFISGQVPADAQGKVPPDFRSQCRQAWTNIEAQLKAADMTLDAVLSSVAPAGPPGICHP